jgi:hypothetical protein
VAVIAVLAGTTKPLAVLVPALAAFLIVALLVELWPRLHVGVRVHGAASWAMDRSPVLVDVRRRPSATVPPQGERGWLDFRRDGERAAKDVSVVVEEMTKAMERQSKQTNHHARRADRAARRNYSAERIYRLTEAAAKDMNSHAARMEGLEQRYRTAQLGMIQNLTDLLRVQPDAELGDLTPVADVAAESRTTMRAYRDSVQGLRDQNISQPMNRATERLILVVEMFYEDVDTTERFFRQHGGTGAAIESE